MNNSTFVLKLLVLVSIFCGAHHTHGQNHEQPHGQNPSSPLILQALASPDDFLTYPKDWLPDKKLLVVYIDSACDSCIQSVSQMEQSAKEVLTTEIRWFFVVNHKTWPLARIELQKVLSSPPPFQNFYHDPGGRFRSYFGRFTNATSTINIFSFHGESLKVMEIKSAEDLKGSLMKIREAIKREEKTNRKENF